MGRWVAVEGVVGTGKTTTVDLVAGGLGMEVILEHPDEHPLLGAYHQSPERYAFETELIFMAMHRHHIRQAGLVADLLTDFAPAKDIVFGALVLGDNELATLKYVHQHLWAGGEKPTMVLFLDVPIVECVRRVKGRGRPYEAALTRSFLERLRERYLTDLNTLGDCVVKVDLDGTETRHEVAKVAADLIAPAE